MDMCRTAVRTPRNDWSDIYQMCVCVNYDVWSGPSIKFFDTFKLVKVYPSNVIKFAFKLIHTMMLNRTLWLFMELVKHDLLVYLKRLRDVHTTRTCKPYRIVTVYWCSLIGQMHVQCVWTYSRHSSFSMCHLYRNTISERGIFLCHMTSFEHNSAPLESVCKMF